MGNENLSSLPNLPGKNQSKFEGGAYFILNLIGVTNALIGMNHLKVIGFITSIISLIIITLILIIALFLPFLSRISRHSKALLIFICLIAYATAIGDFVLSF